MADTRNPLVARLEREPSVTTGAGVGLVAVALVTALLYPLKEIAPAIALGVVYLLAVLLVASIWGPWLGIATSVASALAFNFFHIPPTGRLSISTGENWVALVVYLIAAVGISAIGESARTRAREADERRREADLAAELARLLLRGGRLVDELPTVSARIASTLGLPSVAIELRPVDGDERRTAFPLREHSSQLGTLLVPAELDERTLARLQLRVVPAIEALLAAALERDELLAETLETATLRRSDVVKTALLRSVSHDLRSPLTAILTAGAGLRSPSLDDAERAELAGVVEEESGRLGRLIDNLLDLSRLEADAADPRPDWCDIGEVLHAAADDLNLGEDAFAFSIDGDLPELRADAAQLERAFANLLENAARYGNGHPVSVRARAVGRRLIVRVVDRGPGVPAAQRARIFEPFYRSGTERTGHRGSGLGLAITRGFVEANGGTVAVESLPGQGATFVVELALEREVATA